MFRDNRRGPPRGGFNDRGDRGFSSGGGFNQRPPVNVGDELDVSIEAVGEKGDGIAKKDGFILFVPNTKEGDRLRIRVTKVLRKVGFAERIGPATGDAPSKAGAPAGEEPAQSEEQPEDTENFGEESQGDGDLDSENLEEELDVPPPENE